MELGEAARLQEWGIDQTAAAALVSDYYRSVMDRGEFSLAKDSVHWLLAAGLKRSRRAPARILEIGTSAGEFTAFLAWLFPAAEIVTLDLPSDHPLVSQFIGAIDSERRRDLQRSRERYLYPLVEAGNVRFLESNSFFLLDHVEGKFDLIWVDGGHLLPDVAWDLANAFYLCEDGGLLLCDDIIPDATIGISGLSSNDSLEIVEMIAAETGSRTAYFLKRRRQKIFSDPRFRKYVAMVEVAKKPS